MTLAYDLPVRWIKKLGMKKLTVSVTGNTLYYFTKVSGSISPESGAGADGNLYKSTSTAMPRQHRAQCPQGALLAQMRLLMLHYNQDKTMKSKKLLIALAGCAAFVATACHGDLDIIQDNQLTASNMWTESSDVTTSAYGIYYLMRANFVQDKVNVFYWGEARVGEYMWGAGSWRTGHDNDMYGVQNSTMNDSNASTVWTKLYTAVNAANAVLKYAPTVPMTDADRQWAIGQAAFAVPTSISGPCACGATCRCCSTPSSRSMRRSAIPRVRPKPTSTNRSAATSRRPWPTSPRAPTSTSPRPMR